MPTSQQLEGLYRICYYLTYRALQPIHLICLDERTGNLFILAGDEENIEMEITPIGEVL
ncbi:hypothetical protein GM3708_1521 [Geminocystis sp. NIES-3708]|uniref:DUF6888 family protein n=1 Tax=Geminocystis sp. NIES-3708 TaxID=1615909 RepID=UPI0005FCCD61|nr:hypothetical protein [Geminocystis sp. NIES-3708]BAQ61115.1 hypothetical protein GM3708_1521 [Geminocystis sp. NIES-3708]